MAVTRFASHLDMQHNEFRRARFEAVDELPEATADNIGWIVRLTTDNQLYVSTGTGWRQVAGASVHEHVQAVPQAVVTVAHNLGYRPAVTAFSPDFGQQFDEFQVEHLDENTLRVSMDNPQACRLVMS